MQWQTKVANYTAAKRMIQPWAEALRKGLDKASDPDKQNQDLSTSFGAVDIFCHPRSSEVAIFQIE